MNDTTPPPGIPGDDGAPTGDGTTAGTSGASNNGSSYTGAHSTGEAGGGSTGTATGDAGPHSSARTSDRFFTWLRRTGITRSSDRWFAGVAGGIAAKANIDPLIVRGIFVVLAVLGGPGILLYLAAWVLLPDSSGRIHLEEIFRGRASAGAIVTTVVLGAILVIPTIIWLFRAVFLGPLSWGMWDIVPNWMQVTLGVLWWAVVVPALVVWLIIWLSNRSGKGSSAFGGAEPNSAPGQPSSFEQQANNFSAQATDFANRAGERAQEWGNDFGQKAEDWGRRVESKSKEWEQRGREYHEAHKLGAVHVVVTLALTLLTAGAAASFALFVGAENQLVLTAGIVSGVAVLAISTIIAGIRGRESGWIGFLSFCGVIALLFAPFSTVLPANTQVIPFGESVIRPGNTGDDHAIVKIGGNVTVDLSELGQNADARNIDVWLLGGNTTVRLPEAASVRVQVNLMAGNIRDHRLDSDERRQGGILMARTFEQPGRASNTGDTVTVRVRMLGGNVSISDRQVLSSTLEDRVDEVDELLERIEELESAR